MNLDELIENAGDAKESPPIPAKGIPKQKIPSWIRWPVRIFLLPFVTIDMWAQKFARFLIPPPYKKVGKCLKRGNCCHFIMMRKAKGFLGWCYRIWYTEFHGFYLRTEEEYEYEEKPVLVMGCRYLKKDGSCAHYSLRPMICRKWPVIEHFGKPRILKGCGFKVVPSKPKNLDS